MEKTIDLTKNLYEICREYPDVIRIMQMLGFDSIASPGMLNTAGRIMTIPKGAAMKKIPMDRIKDTFKEKGYLLKE